MPRMSKVTCVICGRHATIADLDEWDMPSYEDAIAFTAMPGEESVYEGSVLHLMIHDDCAKELLESHQLLETDPYD